MVAGRTTRVLVVTTMAIAGTTGAGTCMGILAMGRLPFEVVGSASPRPESTTARDGNIVKTMTTHAGEVMVAGKGRLHETERGSGDGSVNGNSVGKNETGTSMMPGIVPRITSHTRNTSLIKSTNPIRSTKRLEGKSAAESGSPTASTRATRRVAVTKIEKLIF